MSYSFTKKIDVDMSPCNVIVHETETGIAIEVQSILKQVIASL